MEIDLVERISELLACGDVRGVKTIMSGEEFQCVLQEKANDLIPVAAYHLNKEAVSDTPAVVRCAEKLILKCAEKGNPKECLLEFLAQFEILEEVKFQTLLHPIQMVLLRIPDRKAPLTQCVFNVIYSFINSLPLPQCQLLDSRSKLLLNCDKNAQRITDIYHQIVPFYVPFVDEISGQSPNDKRIQNLRLALLQALLHLLGNPLVTLDLEHNEKGSSVFRMLASKILELILKLEKDLVKFLILVEDKQLISVEEEKTIINEFCSNEFKFSNLSISVLCYLVFSEGMCPTLPAVYDKLFIFQNSLMLAVTLLQYKETMVLRKGLLLIKTVLGMVKTGTVPFSCLHSNSHKEIIEHLSNVAIFHDVEENRKLAVELIKQHFSVFEPKGQFYILMKNGGVAQHPILVGFMTTMLTNSVRNSFSDVAFREYFAGKRLCDLLDVFCSLEKGAETDLIEHKNQILSALNLIIFLTRRDRDNTTGLWNYVHKLCKQFLCPLREGVTLSRAHYELQLKNLGDPLKSEDGSELSVTVGGQELSLMSMEEKKQVINSGLTVFDLIEHLLSRAEECVEDKPFSGK